MKKILFLTIFFLSIFALFSCASSDSTNPGSEVSADDDVIFDGSDNSNLPENDSVLNSDSDENASQPDGSAENDTNTKPDESNDNNSGNDADNTPSDTTAPEVSSYSPADKSVDLPVDQKITIEFSESLDASTVEGNIILKTETNTVETNIMFESSSKIVVTPKQPLSFLTLHTVYVSTKIKDLAGNSLKALPDNPEYGLIFSFTTLNDPNPPEIKSKYPEMNTPFVTKDVKVKVVFDRPVEKMDDTFIVLKDASNNEVEGTATLNIDTIEFVPANALIEKSTYSVEIIKDTIASKINPEKKFEGASWTFKVSDGVIFFDDFDGHGYPSAKPVWSCLAHDTMNTCNNLKLWNIGEPNFDFPKKGTITEDYDAEGTKALGTFSTGFSNYNIQGYKSMTQQATVLNTPLLIPENGAVLEFYAYVWTQIDSGNLFRDGMYVILCNKSNCTPADYESGKDYFFQDDITVDSDIDFIGQFTDFYNSANNPSFKHQGIRGRQTEPNRYVKFTVNIAPEMKGTKYLHFVFSSENSGNTNSSSDYGTNGAGIYIDDVILRVK